MDKEDLYRTCEELRHAIQTIVSKDELVFPMGYTVMKNCSTSVPVRGTNTEIPHDVSNCRSWTVG